MKRCIVIMGMVLCLAESQAQDLGRSRAHSALDEFRKEARADFENFRKKCMEDFLSFVRNPWKAFEAEAPVPVPEEKPLPPVKVPEEDSKPPVEDTPVPIEEVIQPQPTVPQPQPVVPIEEDNSNNAQMSFTFFGTSETVRFDTSRAPRLRSVDINEVATFLEKLENGKNDNLIHDCLQIREKRRLSDWAYLQMIKAIAETVYGKGTNDAELLKAYVYGLSGYKMRIGQYGNTIKMLFASRNMIFGLPSFEVGKDNYYCEGNVFESMYICEAAFPQEKQMSLNIPKRQQFDMKESSSRTISSKQYPDFKVSTSVNRNLLDFYSSYPTSCYGGDFMTRWAMFANTPMQDEVCRTLYPQLKAKMEGCSELEKVSRLLNLLQTGLVYEYDDKVWGGDRAFFSEETLYYPYCDCEDRSILLTRLVRDLLGLKCILIYYPGHLACAVEFNEDVKGDYISLQGRKFIVCDPTYIGAPVGVTMKGMDNAKANVILLE